MANKDILTRTIGLRGVYILGGSSRLIVSCHVDSPSLHGDEVNFGLQAKDSTDPLWVYMSTPMGYGKAEVSPQVVAQYARVSQLRSVGSDSGNELSSMSHPRLSGSYASYFELLERSSAFSPWFSVLVRQCAQARKETQSLDV